LFVTVEKMGISGNENERTVNLKIHFQNHGKTPALLKSLRYYVQWSDQVPNELIDQPNANRELPQGLVVGRDKDWSQGVHERITEEQLRDLGDVVNRIFVVGLMKYEDVLGKTHEVGFCWMSQPQARNAGFQFTIIPSRLNYFT
jgi:hypothetical protein